MIVWAQDPRLVEWVNAQMGIAFVPEQVRTIAHVDGTSVLAVVVYSSFTEFGCEMTIASGSPKWCTRRFIRAAFHYPFKQCGMRRVTFITTDDNAPTKRLLERLGAKHEGTLRQWFETKDGIVYGLLNEDWHNGYLLKIDRHYE